LYCYSEKFVKGFKTSKLAYKQYLGAKSRSEVRILIYRNWPNGSNFYFCSSCICYTYSGDDEDDEEMEDDEGEGKVT
jgi:hypothetical protein